MRPPKKSGGSRTNRRVSTRTGYGTRRRTAGPVRGARRNRRGG